MKSLAAKLLDQYEQQVRYNTYCTELIVKDAISHSQM